MKKPDREELYKSICRKIGTVPRESSEGYFSREEMLELFTYLEHVSQVIGQVAELRKHPALQQAVEKGGDRKSVV